jgi:AcrR family transcriptional regulator
VGAECRRRATRPTGLSSNVVDTRPTVLYSQGVASNVPERILKTASDLFYKEGVRAVGIQRVIEEAGIATASLYAHYASKDDLVAACIDDRASASRAHVEAELADPALDARGKLLRLFELQGAWIADPAFRGCPFLNATSEIADAAHPARAVTTRHRAWLHGLFRSLAEGAGADAPADLAGALVVLYDGAAASALIDQDPQVSRYARRAVERLLDAHLPAKRRSRAQGRRSTGARK